jgi:hypothetical protein
MSTYYDRYIRGKKCAFGRFCLNPGRNSSVGALNHESKTCRTCWKDFCKDLCYEGHILVQDQERCMQFEEGRATDYRKKVAHALEHGSEGRCWTLASALGTLYPKKEVCTTDTDTDTGTYH